MKKSSSTSMYAWFPLRGHRRSVSSLGGQHNVMWNETQTDGPRPLVAPPVKRTELPVPHVAGDQKQIMRGLNSRLNGYLDKVMPLNKKIDQLNREINEILAKRKAVKGRDWHETQKTLEKLRLKIKERATENDKLLMEANNGKLTNNDLHDKLSVEINAKKVLEKELEDMKKTMQEFELQNKNTKKETDMVMVEIDHFQKEHKEKVDVLCDKIRTSKVEVTMRTESNNLRSIINEIRCKYEKINDQNWKETEERYRKQFEEIQVVEDQNTEDLKSRNAELKMKQKSKLELELKIQGVLGKITMLERILKDTRAKHGNRPSSFNDEKLDSEIQQVNSEIEQQIETNKILRTKLQQEIRIYRELLSKVSSDHSWGLYVEDAVDSKTPDDDEVVQQQQQKK